jgi:membrane-associated phospholipid phosphatase
MSVKLNAITRSLSAKAALVALIVTKGGVLQASTTDPGAGSWKMIVLSSASQVPVPAPAPVTDAGYLAELSAVKTAQSSISTKQRQAVDYWNQGGVLNWNQILLGLVAGADLPPEPNPDDSYSFPSAATPFAFPQYPFANPPYAARSYSYIAVATYEALKSAWYYKYLYNRPTPYNVDKSISALSPGSDLPGYPSEDAVVSAVNQTLLSVLFPTQVALINQKAAEQQQAAVLSGRASASDIAAGIALGQAVAAIFVTRAGQDGMKNATGTQAQWDAIAAAAIARGEIPWKSLEIPPRPPMLPFFGSVQTWMMTSQDVLNSRPGPPPSTSSTQMQSELAEVRAAVKNITRAQAATSYKWADGASSPTPPGHWNFIADNYLQTANFSEVRVARALALVNMALHDAAVACWDTKYAYFNPRPTQLDPSLRTEIALPNFPSYESGHSVFSGAAATVLSYLFPQGANYFAAQRDEAAMSRLYSGIHFRSDIEIGKTHGNAVGAFAVKFAQTDGADSGQ